MVAVGVTAYGIGSMRKNGQLARVPQLFGMPHTVTLAVAAKLISLNTGGKMKQAANGAAMAAASIALYQFGNGESVSGYISGGRERTLTEEAKVAKRLAAAARDDGDYLRREFVQQAFDLRRQCFLHASSPCLKPSICRTSSAERSEDGTLPAATASSNAWA